MDDPIELLAEEPEQEATPGIRVPGPVLVSFIVHTLLVIFLIKTYRPIQSNDTSVPIVRYVELIKQNPKDFVESPGKKLDKAPINAPYSDGNRRASAPRPTGEKPTTRPGDGRTMYTPPMGGSEQAAPPQKAVQPSPQIQQQQQKSADESQTPLPQELADSSRIPAYRNTHQAGMTGGEVNWRSAIKEVGKVATLGGGQNLDLSKLGGSGGEKGFAEQGPLSFESQWYDWGEYAAGMVAKIRLNWYENMPPLIRTGMKGVVTIRFTIQRDGRITDIETLNSSTVPPYDFAAKKAIELSTPLNPLPKDFPEASERVTCMFFYNSEPPGR